MIYKEQHMIDKTDTWERPQGTPTHKQIGLALGYIDECLSDVQGLSLDAQKRIFARLIHVICDIEYPNLEISQLQSDLDMGDYQWDEIMKFLKKGKKNEYKT